MNPQQEAEELIKRFERLRDEMAAEADAKAAARQREHLRYQRASADANGYYFGGPSQRGTAEEAARKAQAQTTYQRIQEDLLGGFAYFWDQHRRPQPPPPSVPNGRVAAAEVLGLSADWTAADLKRAYRRRAKETHPDVGGDPAEFRKVQEAWEALRHLA